MNLLILAPQPFYQERGTPIAIRLAISVLMKRENYNITLFTYHEGIDLELDENVKHLRIKSPKFIKDIPIGFSIRKLICDCIMFIQSFIHILKNRKKYQLIHANEETVFFALIFKIIFRIPYVYDMDSSLSSSISDKFSFLKILIPIFKSFEKIAIKNSSATITMCDALTNFSKKINKNTFTLRDISLSFLEDDTIKIDNLRSMLKIDDDCPILMYVGNLIKVQGIDLMIDSFEITLKKIPHLKTIIIGGSLEKISFYKDKYKHLIDNKSLFLIGKRPVATLSKYLSQADCLCIPRLYGENTPLKIYPFLHSGVPVIATNLKTNTQVLNTTISALANPNALDFSKALIKLFTDNEYRINLGKNGFEYAEENFTFKVFNEKLNSIYDKIENLL